MFLRYFSSRKKRITIPKAVREQVWLKDMGPIFSGKCSVSWCENEINVFDFTIGHNVPVSKGGSNKFKFPYVIDETQEVAKNYDAVCTPDFFGYNKDLELQYRGRIRELKELKPVRSGESDLYKAMKQISETGKGPESQIPSMGCNIKWLNN